MDIKCKYCGNVIQDTDEKCIYCGAINMDLERVANEIPKTIEQLQQWYIVKKLPPKETTRFFIGEDCKESKAFGIYQDEKSGDFIVYVVMMKSMP